MRNSKMSIKSNLKFIRQLVRRKLAVPVVAATALALALSAQAAQQFYQRTNLVSDVPGFATFTDSSLKGAWGTTHSATSPWWVNSTMGGVSLVFDGTGQPFPTNSPLKVTVPPPLPSTATGVVFNGGGGFDVAPGKSAVFLFATLNGVLSGWNPGVNPAVAVVVVSNANAQYSGLTIAPLNGSNALFAANFGENKIDVFDQTFTPIVLGSNAFANDDVPSGLSVFNVQLIDSNLLFVTYAPTNVLPATTPPGAGFVSVFDTMGHLAGHLHHGPWMNAPWGVTLAPTTAKPHGHHGESHEVVLVGMFGSGQIAQFDAEHGDFRGLLKDADGDPINIGKGLWGIGFGNGATAGPTNVLYFAADMVSSTGFHGVFGAFLPLAHPNDGDNDGDDNGDQDGGHGND